MPGTPRARPLSDRRCAELRPVTKRRRTIHPQTGRVLYVPIKNVDASAGTVTFDDEDGREWTLPVTGGHVKLFKKRSKTDKNPSKETQKNHSVKVSNPSPDNKKNAWDS